MEQRKSNLTALDAPALIRIALLSWLSSVTIEFILKPGILSDLSTLAEMSLLRVLVLTAMLSFILLFVQHRIPERIVRWILLGLTAILSAFTLYLSFTAAFMVVCAIVLLIIFCYCVRGWNAEALPQPYTGKESKVYVWVTGIAAAAFFLFVSVWTVCRVTTFSTPSYDFGIFSQMFYNMKQTGLPITTLERDGLLSHFKVHMSPIYYLLLPFYLIVPTPATLQVLQAAVLASAVIPLWLLGKRHGLSPLLRMLICSLLLVYPAYSGGTSYDIHENAFLTPLILWLFYALDCRKKPLTVLFTVLVLMVKEDAAVYTAVIGLFVLLRSALRKDGRSQIITGITILGSSVIWFLLVTAYLSHFGDGVMTYRYNNFMYDGSGSLITVIKAVLMCPMKALFECVDSEKIEFILYTMLPLLGIPLITRRYERFVLLIPYILVNLMSDYQYQHDIFFQYTFGSTACLFYLVTVNLADIKRSHTRLLLPVAAVVLSFICVVQTVVPVAKQYPQRYQQNRDTYQQAQQLLETIPADASVAATTQYTTPLSQREYLYDIRYTTKETVLSCEYVVLSTTSKNCYNKYAADDSSGFDNLVSILLENSYVLEAQLEGSFRIYRKA